jgi:hypothetical protein
MQKEAVDLFCGINSSVGGVFLNNQRQKRKPRLEKRGLDFMRGGKSYTFTYLSTQSNAIKNKSVW